MSETLISSNNTFALLAVTLGIALIGVRLEHTKIGQRISGAMIAIVLAAALGNLKIIPSSSPVFALIWVYLVPLAIGLFLIKADLVTIFRNGGRTLSAFVFGAIGTVVGTYLGAVFLPLGAHAGEYAAIFSATFIGGALNFAAVADAIGFRNPNELAAALAIDNVLGLSYLVLLGVAARWSALQRLLPADIATERQITSSDQKTPGQIQDFLLALTISAAACATGKYVSNWFGHADYSILYITIIMIAVATIARRWLHHLDCAELLAMIFMYLFFVMLGTGANISAMFKSALSLFFYVVTIIAIHSCFTLVGAKIFRINYREAVIASSACIGGPPIAVAIAVLFGWRNLVTAGVVTGVFGYAVGNFIGLGIYTTLE